MIHSTKAKIATLCAIIALTVAIHYGWVLEHIFGHSAWVHALHSRFCYLPIVIAAAWFGVRGGLLVATAISALVLPYLLGAVTTNPQHITNLSQELIEIFFYYVIGFLIGWLVEREMRSRRKHQEAQLALERSHHLSMVGQMAANVAHEIKNPLASIKGAVEILCEDDNTDQARDEFKGIITSEIKRIDGTVREFLEYARPKEIKLAPMDFSAALQSSLRQIEVQLTQAGLCLESEIEPELLILGDPEKLHQVTLNLMLNAAEASQPGALISVSLKRNGKQDVRLIIRDHGSGISASDADRVFEPFYTTKASGSGLGLPIVKSIIERHSGTVILGTVPGGGTEAAVTLPLAKEGVWR